MKYIIFTLALIGSSFADLSEKSENFPFKALNASNANGRIVNGTATSIKRFPWQLSLKYGRRHVCGASLLSATRGLTAAHCFTPRTPAYRYFIQAGTANRKGHQDGHLNILSEYILHPEYRSAKPGFRYDIAILYFRRPMPLSARIRPIALPAQNATVPFCAKAFISGWGQTSVNGSLASTLKFTTVPVISNERCNAVYQGVLTVNTEMFCAGYPAGGRGLCHADNGGALVVNEVQLGIGLWSRGCAQVNSPAIFTRVSAYSDWIREHL